MSYALTHGGLGGAEDADLEASIEELFEELFPDGVDFDEMVCLLYFPLLPVSPSSLCQSDITTLDVALLSG